MIAYYYPLWRRQYFFHPMVIKDKSLLSIYRPYSTLTKIVWFAWKKNWFIRRVSVLSIKSIPFDLRILEYIVDKFDNYTWVINLGSEYEERRTTLLLKNKFTPSDLLFVKIGFKDSARKLVRNEIAALNELSKSDLTPKIKHSGDYSDFTFLVTNAFNANKLKSVELNEDILKIIIYINSLKVKYLSNKNGIIYSFSHGDLCPWNILEENCKIKIIDWERASYQPLGYDLFTYIFQTNFELFPKRSCNDILMKNRIWIDKFFLNFNIINWHSYLTEFALIKQADCLNDKKLNTHIDHLLSLCKDNL